MFQDKDKRYNNTTPTNGKNKPTNLTMRSSPDNRVSTSEVTTETRINYLETSVTGLHDVPVQILALMKVNNTTKATTTVDNVIPDHPSGKTGE